jgi:TolA-binding protein
MDCPHEHDIETAERYVSGALSEPEQAAFEAHYFACARCLADVQALQDVWQSLSKSPRPATAATSPSRASGAGWLGWPTWSWGALAAALVAVAVSWSMWPGAAPPPDTQVAARQPGGAEPGATPPSTTPSTTPPSVTPAVTPSGAPSTSPSTSAEARQAPAAPVDRAALLRQLAVVVAPPYLRLATRGATEPASDFDGAMEHYAAGRYAPAAEALRPLADGAASSAVRARFFLGICELVLGRVDDGRAALSTVAASGTTPYADEAHFYLAKAALAAADVDTARRELAIAVDREAGPEGEAARLLARLR